MTSKSAHLATEQPPKPKPPLRPRLPSELSWICREVWSVGECLQLAKNFQIDPNEISLEAIDSTIEATFQAPNPNYKAEMAAYEEAMVPYKRQLALYETLLETYNSHPIVAAKLQRARDRRVCQLKAEKARIEKELEELSGTN